MRNSNAADRATILFGCYEYDFLIHYQKQLGSRKRLLTYFGRQFSRDSIGGPSLGILVIHNQLLALHLRRQILHWSFIYAATSSLYLLICISLTVVSIIMHFALQQSSAPSPKEPGYNC